MPKLKKKPLSGVCATRRSRHRPLQGLAQQFVRLWAKFETRHIELRKLKHSSDAKSEGTEEHAYLCAETASMVRGLEVSMHLELEDSCECVWQALKTLAKDSMRRSMEAARERRAMERCTAAASATASDSGSAANAKAPPMASVSGAASAHKVAKSRAAPVLGHVLWVTFRQFLTDCKAAGKFCPMLPPLLGIEYAEESGDDARADLIRRAFAVGTTSDVDSAGKPAGIKAFVELFLVQAAKLNPGLMRESNGSWPLHAQEGARDVWRVWHDMQFDQRCKREPRLRPFVQCFARPAHLPITCEQLLQNGLSALLDEAAPAHEDAPGGAADAVHTELSPRAAALAEHEERLDESHRTQFCLLTDVLSSTWDTDAVWAALRSRAAAQRVSTQAPAQASVQTATSNARAAAGQRVDVGPNGPQNSAAQPLLQDSAGDAVSDAALQQAACEDAGAAAQGTQPVGGVRSLDPIANVSTAPASISITPERCLSSKRTRAARNS